MSPLFAGAIVFLMLLALTTGVFFWHLGEQKQFEPILFPARVITNRAFQEKLENR